MGTGRALIMHDPFNYSLTRAPSGELGLNRFRFHHLNYAGKIGPQPGPTGATIAFLFYYLVSARKQCWRDCEAERIRGFEIDHQFELCRLLDREITRLLPL